MDDILGTSATNTSDLVLLAYVFLLLPGMIIGFFFARRKMFVPYHKFVMTGVTLVNWVLIAFVMVVTYSNYIAPYVPENFSDIRAVVATVHLLSGAIAQGLATYLVILMWTERTRFEGLLPAVLRIRRIKTPMRLTLFLWITTVVLGLGIYFTWYVGADEDPSSQAAPGATEQAGPGGTEDANANLALTEDANANLALTEDANGNLALTEDANGNLALTEDASANLALTEDASANLALTEDANANLALTEDANANLAMTEAVLPCPVVTEAVVVDDDDDDNKDDDDDDNPPPAVTESAFPCPAVTEDANAKSTSTKKAPAATEAVDDKNGSSNSGSGSSNSNSGSGSSNSGSGSSNSGSGSSNSGSGSNDDDD